MPAIAEALASDPNPMSPMEQYMLSWEAATERLLDAAALPEGAPRTNERPSHALAYYTHYGMGIQPNPHPYPDPNPYPDLNPSPNPNPNPNPNQVWASSLSSTPSDRRRARSR